MKENYARSSDPANRRSKDSQLKNKKKKILIPALSNVSLESTEEPLDCASIPEISDLISDAESFAQGSSSGLLFSPETCAVTYDLSQTSTINNVDGHTNLSVSVRDQLPLTMELQTAVTSLQAEINELKKLIHLDDVPEERDRMVELVSVKFRVAFLSFLLWIVMVLIILFLSSRDQVGYFGPPAT